MYIGLVYNSPTGKYLWSHNQKEPDHFWWACGQPQKHARKDCVGVSLFTGILNPGWHDYFCSDNMYAICEVD